VKKLSGIACTGLILVASAAVMADDGATTYRMVCSSCHETAAAGAPLLDDKAEWKPRIAQGRDALYASIINGKCKVSVQDLRKDITDEMIKTTVGYMVSEASQSIEDE
jgi:cytochrome c5